ncbi:cytochrome P450, partial [Shouchella clausii]|nr:cytochrome P450 [Shouchella clausii]
MKPTSSEPIDLFSDQFHQQPYTYYKDIREQTGFAKVMLPYGIPAWMAFHYDVAEAVLKDERFIKDARTVFPDEAL